jgi:arsenate reductase
MTDSPIHVLFLCNHNAGRSLLAEAVLNHIGGKRFRGFSAGSSPRDNQQPDPLALQVLRSAGISTDGLRSKNWDEFGEASAPHMDLIITVCDDAAGEVGPCWPGHPATAHWGYPDPTAGDDTQAHHLQAFRQTLHALHLRLELLVNLPTASIDRLLLEQAARELHPSS